MGGEPYTQGSPTLWLTVAAGPAGCLWGSAGPSLRVPSIHTPPPKFTGWDLLGIGRGEPRHLFWDPEAPLVLLNHFPHPQSQQWRKGEEERKSGDRAGM